MENKEYIIINLFKISLLAERWIILFMMLVKTWVKNLQC